MLRQYLLAYVGRKVDLSLIAGYARHILSLPMNFFEMRQVGEILSRVNDAAKVREAISGATLTAVVDGVVVVFTTAVLWMYDTQPGASWPRCSRPLLVVAVMRASPGHAPPLARSDGGRRQAFRAPGRGHLRRRNDQGLRRRAAADARKASTASCGWCKSIFSLQKLSISMTRHRRADQRPGRHRHPVVRRPSRDRRRADDRRADVLLHAAGLHARAARSDWPRSTCRFRTPWWRSIGCSR